MHALSAAKDDGVGGVDVIAMDAVISGGSRPASGGVFQDGFDCQMP
jgi:hypothetical protein